VVGVDPTDWHEHRDLLRQVEIFFQPCGMPQFINGFLQKKDRCIAYGFNLFVIFIIPQLMKHADMIKQNHARLSRKLKCKSPGHFLGRLPASNHLKIPFGIASFFSLLSLFQAGQFPWNVSG